MIYRDTSVALAHLFVEDRRPPPAFWNERLIASQLLQYEVWCRISSLDRTVSHGDASRQLLARVGLATIEFLRGQGRKIELASYDERLLAVAKRLDVPIAAA